MKKILISPIGEFDSNLLKEVGSALYRIFGYGYRIEPLISDLSFAFNKSRDQYHSTQILKRLASMAPDGCLKILALTRVDLFIPILTYVFGEAQLNGKACIVSTSRLNEDNLTVEPEKVFKTRVVKESLHEIGHTFNLTHCRNTDCIMNFCRSVKEVDARKDVLCRYCKVLLEDQKKRLDSAAAPQS
ncbi:MAG: archaemetzincin [Desulfobacterales bacterium]